MHDNTQPGFSFGRAAMNGGSDRGSRLCGRARFMRVTLNSGSTNWVGRHVRPMRRLQHYLDIGCRNPPALAPLAGLPAALLWAVEENGALLFSRRAGNRLRDIIPGMRS
jgi:hypothetical protein